MQRENPYVPPDTKRESPTIRRQSRRRLAFVGFLAGAALPTSFGIYLFYQEFLLINLDSPNAEVCGTQSLGWLSMIFVLGPLGGIIGAVTVWIASGIDWWAAL